MKIEKLKVYDLEESMIASGYPMRTELDPNAEVDEKVLRRCCNLTKMSNGNGAHGQWMTGVRVAFDLTCTNKMWVEAERYRFLEFTSSCSSMHRIAKFDLDKSYVPYVDPRVIAIMKEKVAAYNALEDKTTDEAKDLYLEILYTNPAGFELTARLTTNYRCLLNIYIQRHDHRLPEWREFCQYMYDNLPFFPELVQAYYDGE